MKTRMKDGVRVVNMKPDEIQDVDFASYKKCQEYLNDILTDEEKSKLMNTEYFYQLIKKQYNKEEADNWYAIVGLVKMADELGI